MLISMRLVPHIAAAISGDARSIDEPSEGGQSLCWFMTCETGSGHPRLLAGGRGMASPLRNWLRVGSPVGARPCLARQRPSRHRRAQESHMCLNPDSHSRGRILAAGEVSGLICIDLVNGLATRFDHVFYPCGTSGSGRGGLRRGLITLIFVGWVPPDLSSSRNCLTLGSWFNAPNGACRIARSRVCPRLPTTLRSRCAELCVGTRQAAARGPSTWRAMAQTKPSSSRAIAAQTFWLGLPRRVRCA